jgi:hypothetical protein
LDGSSWRPGWSRGSRIKMLPRTQQAINLVLGVPLLACCFVLWNVRRVARWFR